MLTPNDAITSNIGSHSRPAELGRIRNATGVIRLELDDQSDLNNELRSGFYRQSSFFFNNALSGRQPLTFPTIGGTAALTNPVRSTQNAAARRRFSN